MFCPDCGSWNRAEASRCVRCGIRMPDSSDRRQAPPDPSVTALRQVTGGRYTIMHRVGEGGMASVYCALNVALDSPVVIKVLHPHLSREHEMRERFKREAESAAQLLHPHVCKIIDVGMVDDHVYLVMPYMARGTLSDRIGGHRSLTAETTAAIAAQVATGLDYAHRRGLVHRDIKPDNILFDEHENALVTDFGIAPGPQYACSSRWMKLSHQTIELNPTHPFVIARGGYAHHRNVIVRLTDDDGVEGFGEAAPNKYYGESVSTVIAALGQFKPVLERADPFDLETTEANLNRVLRGNASAKSAVSAALHDMVGKKLGLPVYRLWGLDASTTPQSS